MAVPPFIIEVEHPHRLMDHHFGFGLPPGDILSIVPGPPPQMISMAAAPYFGYCIKNNTDKFQVDLDVQHFKPEEISVKTADGYIVVEVKHGEKRDKHGYVSRQFTRRYVLPEDCTPESVDARLSSDGVLTVTAPRKVPQATQGERQVTITQTGPVRKEVKDEANGDKAQ